MTLRRLACFKTLKGIFSYRCLTAPPYAPEIIRLHVTPDDYPSRIAYRSGRPIGLNAPCRDYHSNTHPSLPPGCVVLPIQAFHVSAKSRSRPAAPVAINESWGLAVAGEPDQNHMARKQRRGRHVANLSQPRRVFACRILEGVSPSSLAIHPSTGCRLTRGDRRPNPGSLRRRALLVGLLRRGAFAPLVVRQWPLHPHSNWAQAARRGALLLGGLNEPLSPGEIQSLRERFTVSTSVAREHEKPDYYATTLPHGSARLGEMLEESAFYSEHLQRISATAMLGVLIIFAVVFVGITLGTPYVGRDTGQTIVRVFLALLVFGMSADVVGAFRAHRDAAKEIRDIRQRLIAADAAGYPIADVLLAFADYNTAVESAPENVPCAYDLRAQYLNERWADYQRDRDERRAALQGQAR